MPGFQAVLAVLTLCFVSSHLAGVQAIRQARVHSLGSEQNGYASSPEGVAQHVSAMKKYASARLGKTASTKLTRVAAKLDARGATTTLRTFESVSKAFGFHTPEELSRLLRECKTADGRDNFELGTLSLSVDSAEAAPGGLGYRMSVGEGPVAQGLRAEEASHARLEADDSPMAMSTEPTADSVLDYETVSQGHSDGDQTPTAETLYDPTDEVVDVSQSGQTSDQDTKSSSDFVIDALSFGSTLRSDEEQLVEGVTKLTVNVTDLGDLGVVAIEGIRIKEEVAFVKGKAGFKAASHRFMKEQLPKILGELIEEHGKNGTKIFVFCTSVATTAAKSEVKPALLSDRRDQVQSYLNNFLGNVLKGAGHIGKMGLKDIEYEAGRYAQIQVSVFFPDADPDMMRCNAGQDIAAIA